ncbi:MAG: hypothetical protein ACK4JY_11445 [Brevundimonas sp.]|uniref:hypothetical protein n=1 Tax=Brevundimonas sp. TaxID=1871086 RepID=UPI00391A66A7
MRKTALLTGVAGLFLLSAPAFAQDGAAPQTPPAAPPTAATEAPAAEAPTLSLQPGMTVRGADGELGVLVGARTHAGAQQLTVQGADGSVRAVPIDGIRQDGEDVVVDFTVEQYATAEAVTPAAAPADPAADTTAEPEAAPDAVTPPAEAGEPMTAPVPDPTVTPPAPTPPTLPPEDTATPAPGEGEDDPTDPLG